MFRLLLEFYIAIFDFQILFVIAGVFLAGTNGADEDSSNPLTYRVSSERLIQVNETFFI